MYSRGARDSIVNDSFVDPVHDIPATASKNVCKTKSTASRTTGDARGFKRSPNNHALTNGLRREKRRPSKIRRKHMYECCSCWRNQLSVRTAHVEKNRRTGDKTRHPFPAKNSHAEEYPK